MEKRIRIGILLTAVVLLCGVWLFVSYTVPRPNNEFTVYLCEDKTLVISDADVLSYDMLSHEMRLSIECANRLEQMKEQLHGRFMIKICGEEIYGGVMLPPSISRSYPCSEVIIVIPSVWGSYRSIKLQMGYPEGPPVDTDPRSNPKVFEYFEKNGKLIRSPQHMVHVVGGVHF